MTTATMTSGPAPGPALEVSSAAITIAERGRRTPSLHPIRMNPDGPLAQPQTQRAPLGSVIESLSDAPIADVLEPRFDHLETRADLIELDGDRIGRGGVGRPAGSVDER